MSRMMRSPLSSPDSPMSSSQSRERLFTPSHRFEHQSPEKLRHSLAELSTLDLANMENMEGRCVRLDSFLRSLTTRNSVPRRIWLVITFLAILYELLVPPFRLGFLLRAEAHDTTSIYSTWHIIECVIVDAILWLDVLICFFVPYLEREKVVSDLRLTARHYVCSGGFFVDIVILAPYYLISVILTSVNSGEPYVVDGIPLTMSVFKLTRICLLVRLFRYFTELEEFLVHIKSSAINPVVARILKWASFVFLLAHLSACAFSFIVLFTGTLDEARTFAMSYEIVNEEISISFRYTLSLYWSLVTMTGYGGVGVYVTIIGFVGSLVTNLDVAASAFREKLDEINDYMRYRHVTTTLQKDIRKYYHYLWTSRKGLDENTIINSLPYYLRVSVATFLHSDTFRSFHLFQYVKNESFLREILVHLTPSISYPSSYIIRQGETGHEMYFLMRGEADVVINNSLVVHTFGPGSFFGEIALLKKTPRTASIRSKTFCDLFVLQKKDFEEITAHFPDEAEVVRQTAEERFKTTKDSKKKVKNEKKLEEKRAKAERKREREDQKRRERELELLKRVDVASKARASYLNRASSGLTSVAAAASSNSLSGGMRGRGRGRGRSGRSRRNTRVYKRDDILKQLKEV